MRLAAASLLLAVVAGCNPRSPAADTSAVVALDTATPVVVNAAADTLPRADSVRGTGGGNTAGRGSAPIPPARKSPADTAVADSATTRLPPLGRDSVIRRRPGQLPVDTSKRP